jgi:hypothetical protein
MSHGLALMAPRLLTSRESLAPDCIVKIKALGMITPKRKKVIRYIGHKKDSWSHHG